MGRKASKLTEKQELYVNGVMEGLSASDAVRAAGYASPTQKTMIARSENVQEALRQAREELEDVTTIRRVDVIDGLMEAISMARINAESAGMVAGWREIAKIMGYYAPETRKIELTGPQEVVQKKLESLSDQELIEMLQKRAILVDVEPEDD